MDVHLIIGGSLDEGPKNAIERTEPGLSSKRSLSAGEFYALVDGEAAQTNTLRWEDYTQTAVDPTDDCTIWYVGDYLKKDAANYSTRIGAFRIPGCT